MTAPFSKRAAGGALVFGFVLLCGLSLLSIAEELCAKHGGKLFDAGYGCRMADGTMTTVFSHLSWPRVMLTVLPYAVVAWILWVRIAKRFDAPRGAKGGPAA
ncbi:MAG: hypothetical protein HY749_08875 [Gammaproteobacteria bacterium]|nr:hypothetical protein [Gammaproteobacteria bacterium]MBI5616814.1 hypothetical protein [Gammaproteobacteria bacterium]